MIYKETYIFHNKDIKTPLIWGLFYKIKEKYNNILYFLKYKEDSDYYYGFTSKNPDYKNYDYIYWKYIIDDIQKILNKYNKDSYENNVSKYITMTKCHKLKLLHAI